MRPIVSFLSDFGLLDPYAGTVKAVMLAICPDLVIVDLTHEVAPQAVAQAAFLAQQSWPYFPIGAVHLAVVDPGVGTAREPLALRTPAGCFVGPDNGILSAALPEEVRELVSAVWGSDSAPAPSPSFLPQPVELESSPNPGGREGSLGRGAGELLWQNPLNPDTGKDGGFRRAGSRAQAARQADAEQDETTNEPSPRIGRGLGEGRKGRVRTLPQLQAHPVARLTLPPGYELRRIANPAIVRRDPSSTFHGRDVFGPVAAHLAAGLPFEQIGPLLPDMLVLPPFRGVREHAVTRGFVIHVDRFGNLITTVQRDDLPPGAEHAEIGGARAPLVQTYGEGEGLVALVGSSGYLEVALVNGSAARELGLSAGAPVTVRGR